MTSAYSSSGISQGHEPLTSATLSVVLTTRPHWSLWRVYIMAGTRAGAITSVAKAVAKSHENEKRRKSAARRCTWCERQSGERRSEIRRTDLTEHAEGCACLSEERQSEIWQTNLTGHAEGHACLSEKQ